MNIDILFHLFTRYFFPGWSLEHLLLVAEKDPGLQAVGLTIEMVADRFRRFGGICRHVFEADTTKDEGNQAAKILGVNPTIFQNVYLGIDTDPKAPGVNVSGYLLSYCNIETAGVNCFKSADLDFTSAYVRGKIRETMKDYSIKDRVNIVVDHLSGEQTDRSGLHLQEVLCFLLAKGSEVLSGSIGRLLRTMPSAGQHFKLVRGKLSETTLSINFFRQKTRFLYQQTQTSRSPMLSFPKLVPMPLCCRS